MNERVKQLAVKLKMTPTDKTRIEYCAVGGERKWWLLGCVEGDQALPGTAGARTVAEAVEGAESWLKEG
jgi:hypothetical protein